jgi:hypothetical protein
MWKMKWRRMIRWKPGNQETRTPRVGNQKTRKLGKGHHETRKPENRGKETRKPRNQETLENELVSASKISWFPRSEMRRFPKHLIPVCIGTSMQYPSETLIILILNSFTSHWAFEPSLSDSMRATPFHLDDPEDASHDLSRTSGGEPATRVNKSFGIIYQIIIYSIHISIHFRLSPVLYRFCRNNPTFKFLEQRSGKTW